MPWTVLTTSESFFQFLSNCFKKLPWLEFLDSARQSFLRFNYMLRVFSDFWLKFLHNIIFESISILFKAIFMHLKTLNIFSFRLFRIKSSQFIHSFFIENFHDFFAFQALLTFLWLSGESIFVLYEILAIYNGPSLRLSICYVHML